MYLKHPPKGRNLGKSVRAIAISSLFGVSTSSGVMKSKLLLSLLVLLRTQGLPSGHDSGRLYVSNKIHGATSQLEDSSYYAELSWPSILYGSHFCIFMTNAFHRNNSREGRPILAQGFGGDQFTVSGMLSLGITVYTPGSQWVLPIDYTHGFLRSQSKEQSQ